MNKKKKRIDISVCIPVYNTERYLSQCLDSIIAQKIEGMVEVLVLSDASPGKDDQGRSAEKIVKEFKKKVRNKFRLTGSSFGVTKRAFVSTISVRYLQNSQNLALIETRRRLVNEASGQYIYMLDSDDFLPQGALAVLYKTAVVNDADIVQGDCFTLDAEGKKHVESSNEFHPYEGKLEGKDIFEGCFLVHKYRPVITAKLIRLDVYQKAFTEIPYIRVHMAEEVIQYFFIALLSKKYVGIKEPVYNYRIGVGITTRNIFDIEDWRKICSTASVITALYAWVEEKKLVTGNNPLDEEEMTALQKIAKAYCIDNVKQLRNNVVPDLYDDAHKMLCDYWGEEAVKNTEEFLNRNK